MDERFQKRVDAIAEIEPALEQACNAYILSPDEVGDPLTYVASYLTGLAEAAKERKPRESGWKLLRGSGWKAKAKAAETALKAAMASWREAAKGAWADDATLDPTTPLAAPHFRAMGRLALLALGPAGGDSTAGADIRLLSARKLVAYIDGGGQMMIRQTLEAAGTDVFLDAATARAILPELETKLDEVYTRCLFSGVVAVSYAWVTPEDPDPQRVQLLGLRPVLVWWMCERARRKLGGYESWADPDAAIQTADFGLFIDFMSMFQPDDVSSTTPAYMKPAEQASFGRALANIGLLYGHRGSTVFKLTNTPLPAGFDPDRVYEKRGWTHLERRLGDLEAPRFNNLDVAAWPAAEAERAAREKVGGDEATAAQRGPPQLRESEEELAAQGDHFSSEFPGTVGALIRGGRGAPVSPKHFEEELKEKVFSFASDRLVCAGLYRGVAEPLLTDKEELVFTKLVWTLTDWRHLGGTLACCPKLRYLSTMEMGLDDAAMAAFYGELGRGAAPALEHLDLTKNKIGDEGVRHLGDALARGAAPALRVLEIYLNKIGDKGACHLGDAFMRGATPAFETLKSAWNVIGDEGARRLSEGLATAAPALKELDLFGNPARIAKEQALTRKETKQRLCRAAGHTLAPFRVPGPAYYCDGCGRLLTVGATCMSCHGEDSCDLDFCEECCN